MNPQRILQTDGLDIIFQNRNKSYGAYELRKNYNKRAKKAMALSILLILSVITYPIVANFMADDLVIPTRHHELANINFIEHEEPIIASPIEPTSKPPKVDVSTTPDIPTEIVPTETIKLHDDTKDEVPVEAITGNETHIGTDDPNTIGSNDGIENGKDMPNSDDKIGDNKQENTKQEEVEIPEDMVLDSGILDEQPEFPGGEDALLQYLMSQITYPRKAVEAGAEGKVTLGFVVNKNGEIDEIKIMKSIGYGCDEEAVRVVEKMPRWKAGKSQGKAVKTYFNLPITFEISK